METDDRIESIAEDCGFNNEEQMMRCAFVRILKTRHESIEDALLRVRSVDDGGARLGSAPEAVSSLILQTCRAAERCDAYNEKTHVAFCQIYR